MARENQLIERVRRRFPITRARALPGPGSTWSAARSGARHGKDGLRVGIGDDAAVIVPVGPSFSRAAPRDSGQANRLQTRPGRHPSSGVEWVITTDAFLENVHFLRKVQSADSVGYKALARATSDIAAMGARGRYFFLTLGLPTECAGKWLDDFLSGMARAARQFGLVLAGGDTTKYPLVVSSLTVVGEIEEGRAILRSGAKPGDLICVSGRLGEAELGLRLVRRVWASLFCPKWRRAARKDKGASSAGSGLYLLAPSLEGHPDEIRNMRSTGVGSTGSGLYLRPAESRSPQNKGAGSTWSPQNKRLPKDRRWVRLTRKHFYPEPRLALGEWLAANQLATSMIDTSDGLSTDLGHICKASAVGAKVWAQKIPIVKIPSELLGERANSALTPRSEPSARALGTTARVREWGLLSKKLDPLEMALHGGEDYELLFTLPKRLVDRLPREIGGVPITVIGEITRSKRILLLDEHGESKSLEPRGWDPFRNRKA